MKFGAIGVSVGIFGGLLASSTIGFRFADASEALANRQSRPLSTNSLWFDEQNGLFACVVTTLAKRACWGELHDPEFGVTQDMGIFPVTEFQGLPPIKQNSEGCALSVKGDLLCWGSNGYGRLGQGKKNVYASKPTKVPSLGRVVHFDEGDTFSCAVNTRGEVWCWGWNYGSAFTGTGRYENRTYPPVRVRGVAGATKVFVLQTRGACALLRTGTLKCWGGGFPDVLQGKGKARSPINLRNFNKVRSIADSSSVSPNFCVVDGVGDVWCWGVNTYGELGTPAKSPLGMPTRILGPRDVINLTMSTSATCALERSGAVWCWGALSFWFGVDEWWGDLSETFPPMKVADFGPADSMFHTAYNLCVLTVERSLVCRGWYPGVVPDGGQLITGDPRLSSDGRYLRADLAIQLP
jgi:alpha-tubulin suppressor-like RCC1 family protein